MRHRTKAPALLLFGILLFLTMTGSVAYFVTTQPTHNLITTSSVGIALLDRADPTGAVPFNSLENINPNTLYSKIPYIENVGPEPVWIRARLSLIRRDEDRDAEIPDLASFIELGEPGTHWLNSEDGFYYYASALASSETTEPLFTSITFRETLIELYPNTEFTFTIDAYATQVKNNGTSPTNATWTEEGV
ncbi:hypothetical protein IJI72_02860 [Candidatus Saccharibacteria bacterium]|nr:hypothetical protein [Candidatus Saccharibacteria bacterium]